MSGHDAEFVDCVDAGADVTRRFYREILASNFRPDELTAEDELVTGLTEAGGDVVGTMATSWSGDILGGFVATRFAASRVLLLSYLAIRPALRGQGLGSRLLEFAVPAWIRQFDPLLVLGEVEDPRSYGEDTNFGDAWARLRLYERLGGEALALDYFQPALGPNLARVPHLLLLSFFVHADARMGQCRVDGAIVEQFLREYFAASEGQGVDAQLQGLLEACRTSGGLALASPSAYLRTQE